MIHIDKVDVSSKVRLIKREKDDYLPPEDSQPVTVTMSLKEIRDVYQQLNRINWKTYSEHPSALFNFYSSLKKTPWIDGK